MSETGEKESWQEITETVYSVKRVSGLYHSYEEATKNTHPSIDRESILCPYHNNSDGSWVLSTELSRGDLMNNPWTGGGVSGSPSVIVPLNTLSNVNGIDLDIKIEWDTTGGITSARFYRGWRLDEVFDYTLANNGTYIDGTAHTVYGTVSQSIPYVTDTVEIRHANQNWNWSFHTANSSDTFGYNNSGFILHGTGSVGSSK